MPVILNLKKCDNVKECGAPTACPTGAFYWDEAKKTLAVDISKCTDCGACAECCSSGAVLVIPDEEEYKEAIWMIEQDESTIEDLFVDRFGAMTVKGSNELNVNEIPDIIKNSKDLSAIEVVDADNPLCLISAIPYVILFKGKKIPLYRIMASGEDLIVAQNKLGVQESPALIFVKDGRTIGSYQGKVEMGSSKATVLQKFIDNLIMNG